MEVLSLNTDQEIGLRQIADQLKLNHSTCANILKTLILRGYVEKEDGNYQLGPKAYYLTHNFSNKRSLLEAAKPHLKALQTEINESCILAILKDNLRVTIHKETSEHELQANTRDEKHAYLTATGRVLIATMSVQEREAFIQQYGMPGDMWSEAKHHTDLLGLLEKIKNDQMALHHAESDIAGVAVPVFQQGKPQGSIGVYLPISRFKNEKKEAIIAALKQTAERINRDLNHKIG
ncbi:transcriptional regulator, IclR family [Parapedobacter indicus]|uniref:Transcriptional regulator, IclR family n=1 Tax=Parapedobacter indicus TaxID=1477437 RepID=A0A1I3CP97_9SPHI|nr:IclR family transcriptional regulator [Parapedobacter indicus]SFH76307.1 transcriptional regulator, IclR family [Parapedobacter indicus]